MRYQSLFIQFLSIGLLVTFHSCSQLSSKKQRDEIDPLHAKALSHFELLPYEAKNPENEISDTKVLLGKTLFFDKRLSKNNTQSCNTCHNLSTFGVDNKSTSSGDLGKNGDRNSPTVFNAALHTSQFWDGRANSVEDQAGMPILNPVEMNMPSELYVEERLKTIPGYLKLFKEAFPNDENPITYNNLKKAIGAFERTLITSTRFDKFLQGEMTALSNKEKEGLKTFMDVGCTTCHIGATLGGTMLQKFPLIGADYKTLTGSKIDDKGKFQSTNIEADKYLFKVPSLLNITETYPYFHDGSVVDLNSAIKIMAKLQLNKDLSDIQMQSIKDFLGALKAEIPPSLSQEPKMP